MMKSLLARPLPILGTPLVSSTGAGSAANLLSNRVGLVHRTAAAAAASVHDFILPVGFGANVDVVAALWSNLRATDTVAITATSLDDVTNPGGYGSGHGTYTGSAYFSAERNTSAGTKSVFYAAPGAALFVGCTAVRVRVTVGPTPHPDGFIQISRLWVGRRLNFGVDYSQLDLVDDDRSVVEQTDYGEDIEDVRRISFGWRPRWRFGSEAEMLAQHQRLVMLGRVTPVLFCPSPTAANAQDILAFGKLRNPAKTSSSAYDIWELAFDVISEAA